MALEDNQKSKKLLKLQTKKRKIIARMHKVQEQIRIEEDRINLKLGKMTTDKKNQYYKMKQAYHMRQEGITFVEIGRKLNLKASQVSKMCQRYSIIVELLEKRDKQ